MFLLIEEHRKKKSSHTVPARGKKKPLHVPYFLSYFLVINNVLFYDIFQGNEGAEDDEKSGKNLNVPKSKR